MRTAVILLTYAHRSKEDDEGIHDRPKRLGQGNYNLSNCLDLSKHPERVRNTKIRR